MNLSRQDFASRILEPLRSGRVALFVGAGLSRGSGLPSWKELFEPLCSRYGVEPYDDYPALADYLMTERRVARRDLVEAICTAIRGRDLKLNANHLLIKQLPVRLLLTTNYDLLLEDLYGPSRLHRIATDAQAAYFDPSLPRTTLIYVHGNVDHVDGMVIAQADYQGYASCHERMIARLQGIFSDFTLLFLGYGVADRNILDLLDHVRLRDRDASRPHYALMVGTGHPAELSRLRGHGIEPLPLADPADLTSVLQDLLACLRDPGRLETLDAGTPEPPAAADRAPPRPAPPSPGPAPIQFQRPANLPNPIPHFTARESELERVMAALGDGQAVAITGLMGMGGIGKTALALEVAHRCERAGRFPDGVCWHALMDKTLEGSLEELAVDLGLTGLAAIPDHRERVARFRRAIRDRRLLFVLDDANYPGRIPPMLQLLAGHPVLITSRQYLSNLDCAVQLDRLDPEPARRLFLRTREGAPDDAAADARLERLAAPERAALDAICGELLGGLPLAISLAAAVAAFRGWDLRGLRNGLERRRLDLLRDHPDGRVTAAAPKDLDVRLSFSLSYDQLPEGGPERLLFDCSGVFADQGFPQSALAAVAGLEPAVADPALDRLCRQHLVIREQGAHGIERLRLRLHPLLREYAIERLAERGDSAPWDRMVEHYVDLVGKEPKALAYEWRNALRAADRCFEVGDAKHGLALALPLDRHLDVSGLWGHREERLGRALGVAEGAEDPRAICWLRFALAAHRHRLGRDGESLARLRDLRAWCARFPGLGYARRVCDHWIGVLASRQGDGTGGEGLALETLRACLAAGDWNRLGATLVGIGERWQALGRPETAEHCFRAAIAIARGEKDQRNLARWHLYLAGLYRVRGRLDDARDALDAAQAHLVEHPDRDQEFAQQAHRAWLALDRDDLPAAREALAACGGLAAGLGSPLHQAQTDRLEGRIAEAEADPPAAESAYRRAVDGFRSLDHPRRLSECLRRLGVLLVRRHGLAQARPLLDEARALLDRHLDLTELARWEAAQALLQATAGYGRESVRLIRRALASLADYGCGDLAQERALETEVRRLLGEAQWAETLAGLAREGLGRETLGFEDHRVQPGPLPATLISGRDGRGMVLIPGGPVPRGPDPYPGWLGPVYLDRHPVTHADYARHLLDLDLPAPPHWPDGRVPPGLGPVPVVGLTLEEARGFAEWAGKSLPLAQELELAEGLREGREPQVPDLGARRRGLESDGWRGLTFAGRADGWRIAALVPGSPETAGIPDQALAGLLLHESLGDDGLDERLRRCGQMDATERGRLLAESASKVERSETHAPSSAVAARRMGRAKRNPSSQLRRRRP